MNTSAPAIPRPIAILGVRVHPVRQRDLVSHLVRWSGGTQQRRAFYANVHAVNLAQGLPDFRDALNSADVLFCDGVGLKLGARILGESVPDRMSPPDWIDDFGSSIATCATRVFALGDEVGVAATFMRSFCAKHPGLHDAGSHHGYFQHSGAENDVVVSAINDSGAQVLLVGLGMPVQERWVVANAHRLRPRVIITVGALYRWYTGIDQRAPKWVTDNGMEWLARLVQSPRRLFRRYVVGNPLFLARVLREKASRSAP